MYSFCSEFKFMLTFTPCSPAAAKRLLFASIKPVLAMFILDSRGGCSSRNISSFPSPKRKLHKGP